MSKDKEMSEEDYLKKHLGDLDNPKNVMNNDIPFVAQPKIDNTRTTDLQFFNFDIKELPCGEFYPSGTVFMVRPAQVREIQSYSMVDDNNFYDIVEKMNDILQSCVRVKYPDGKVGSYIEVKDQDRLFLVFLIRELTFQQGNSLTVNSKCSVFPPVSASKIIGLAVTSNISFTVLIREVISITSISGLPLAVESVKELDQTPSKLTSLPRYICFVLLS